MRVGLESSVEFTLLKKRRDASSGAFSTFRVSEWSVRRKVVAVLALPMILAMVFGGLRVASELSAASDYKTTQQRGTVLAPALTYLAATERLALPAALSDAMGGDATKAYNDAETSFRGAASSAKLDTSQAALVDQITQIGDTLHNGSGTGITATAPVQLGDMARLTNQLIDSTLNSSNGTPAPRVAGLTQAVNARVSLVKQQLLIQSSTKQSSLLDSVWLAAEIGVEGAALDNLKAAGGTGRSVASLISANGTRLGLATTAKVSELGATPRMFQQYDVAHSRLLTTIQAGLATRASAARSRALTDSIIILLALLASVLLALAMAGALINPLRRVRAGALDVAHVKLPETVKRIRNGEAPHELEPIDVHTSEELGQLARAVDDMHRQAVTLATGEAQLRSQVGAMFVTLSRRNTTLVNQQLALIESLEQDEEDPQRLEQLFSLDHLATRMRRTAESLVILGGTTGRTASFEELSVSDVVHAAVSEVQDYQRVRIDAAPDRMISGRVASDVVHLMAELIDNALSYSPPGSPVTIQAAEDGGKVEIEIIDSGLGMAGDALAQANESLTSGGEVTVDTARRMGLFVVSRLAEEHGLKVKLRRNSNGGGIIASIMLPSDVLVSDGPVEHVSVMDAPEQAEEPEVVVDVEPDEEYDPYLERIEEAIAAVTGLPRRRPGSAAPEPVATPAASVSMFESEPEPLPAAFEPIALPSALDALDAPAAPADDVPAAEHDGHDEHDERSNVVTPVFRQFRNAQPVEDAHDAEADLPAVAEVAAAAAATEEVDQPEGDVAEHVEEIVEPEPESPVAEDEPIGEPTSPAADAEHPWRTDRWGDDPLGVTVPATAPVAATTQRAEEPAPEAPWAPAASHQVPTEAPVRLTIRRPLSATPAAAALEGDVVPEDGPAQTPIFGQLSSNWLSDEAETAWTDNEIEKGWTAADRAETADADEEHTRTGLPVRRPGGRLVPGGVSTEPTVVDRDPDAIRNRLAAHAAGVSRGRAAAAAQPVSNDYAHEETGPA
jgi:signal transduction histidine kinase